MIVESFLCKGLLSKIIDGFKLFFLDRCSFVNVQNFCNVAVGSFPLLRDETSLVELTLFSDEIVEEILVIELVGRVIHVISLVLICGFGSLRELV